MAKFLIEYDHGGETWVFTIDADTWDDAERRMAALSSARVLGMTDGPIPAKPRLSVVPTLIG